MVDSYLRPRAAVTAEPPKVKGSRFIGDVIPVRNPERALELVDEATRREHAARHHCWAYRIGPQAEGVRFNDDGEPHGSAGRPILRQIEGRNLSDTLVVVTRYFGGAKLGVGGLVRAYGDAAAAALDAAPLETKIVRERLVLHFDYDDTSAAMHVAGSFDAIISDQTYTETRAALHLAVRQSQVDDLRARFVEALSGRGEIR
ncbi:YigZ family protein [soil metagenome]